MKTSNKFLFAAIVLTLLSLVVYDILLKAAYKSGNYADPYKDFVTLNFKDFDHARSSFLYCSKRKNHSGTFQCPDR